MISSAPPAGKIWQLRRSGPGPVLATAIHDGHWIRPSLRGLCALGDGQRRREEDPWTGLLAGVGDLRLVATRSRFEVDLNRPRSQAVYREPGDCWGLTPWKAPLPRAEVEASLSVYDQFYATLEGLLRQQIQAHGVVIVLDLHSYNHRRTGPKAPPADPARNPEINLGTGTMNRQRWINLVESFLHSMRAAHEDRPLDVRENVKFQGGNMARWIHQNFARHACVLSVEFKKTFMDEWTGQVDQRALGRLAMALGAAARALRREITP